MEIKKEKWQIELEAGNIWRAKEILRSNIRWNYDTKIYLAYGKILFDVKDYYEAGKYLSQVKI
jgi:tetratricopeptide (TPR) repeat protein